MEIITVDVTPFQQNARIIKSSESNDALVIDPGGDVDRILRQVEKNDLTVKEIWLIHSHLDHCGGVKALVKKTGARLKGHPSESEMRAAVLTICNLYGLPAGDMENCPEPDEYLEGGELIEFGGYQFKTLFTPGHSPGHLCFYNQENNLLIAGDTIFAGSIGRTDLPGGDGRQLIQSIKKEILTLPEETRVLSGHGPETSVGVEKRSNPFL